MNNAVWAVKHRPDLQSVVGQPDIIREMEQVVNENFSAVMQHYLFYSPEPGTGKTSVALAMANELGWQIHVFNASSKKQRGIEFVEDELLPMSRVGNYQQIFLLDEADQLTPAAQSALKGVIENSQGFFILTCNDLSKVSPWLQSRCTLRQFKAIEEDDICYRLKEIADIENVMESYDTVLKQIAKAHTGDLRNAVNALQAYAAQPDGESRSRFLRSLVDDPLRCDVFLRLAFKDGDFESAFKELTGIPVRAAIRQVFNFAMASAAKQDSKMKVVDAAVTSERDLIAGVDGEIVRRNFVRLCAEKGESQPL
tara:strand:+ start:8481 stop:9413 length:933 start_codon:yes stop_codon:yes gene_type:complete